METYTGANETYTGSFLSGKWGAGRIPANAGGKRDSTKIPTYFGA